MTTKPDVVAYLHINKENPEHRGVSLYHDASCTSTLTNTEPLIRLSDYEKLARYYKNGIDCFANPCEEHSGERTPPFAEFFEKYGGRCLICLVDNNKAMKAECEALVEALEKYESAFEELFSQCFSNPITNAWGKTVSVAALNDAHAFASSCLAAHRKKGGEA